MYVYPNDDVELQGYASDELTEPKEEQEASQSSNESNGEQEHFKEAEKGKRERKFSTLSSQADDMQRRTSLRLPDTLDIKSGAQDEQEVSVNSDLLTSALDFSTVKMLEMEEIEENMDDLLLNEI